MPRNALLQLLTDFTPSRLLMALDQPAPVSGCARLQIAWCKTVFLALHCSTVCLTRVILHDMQDSQGFDAKVRSRVSEYEASVATQLCNLKQQHEAQMTDLLLRCETERPSRPQHSAEILNGRKIEEALVKQVSAGKATQGGLLAAGADAHLMCSLPSQPAAQLAQQVILARHHLHIMMLVQLQPTPQPVLVNLC